MVGYLDGSLPSTPFYSGQISAETNLIVPMLIKLNERGMLTASSQPSLSAAAYNVHRAKGATPQRAYVQMYVDADNVKYITDALTMLNEGEQGTLHICIYKTDEDADADADVQCSDKSTSMSMCCLHSSSVDCNVVVTMSHSEKKKTNGYKELWHAGGRIEVEKHLNGVKSQCNDAMYDYLLHHTYVVTIIDMSWSTDDTLQAFLRKLFTITSAAIEAEQ
jgi:hypothetical protein